MWKKNHDKKPESSYKRMYDASQRAVRDAFEAYGDSFEKAPRN